MSLKKPLLGLVLKDIKLFAVDRQALVMSILIPVLIATILGWLDSSAANDSAHTKLHVLVVDEDHSKLAGEVKKSLGHNKDLTIQEASLGQAQAEVREGKFPDALIIPNHFERDASAAMTGGGQTPITLLKDPSKTYESEVVEAAVLEDVDRTVARETFGAMADRPLPVTIIQRDASAGKANWAQSAHDYSGFGMQGLLFFAVESGVALSRERRSGIWKRLRTAPVPGYLMLLSRAISSFFLALLIILIMFAIGSLLFGIRIQGSPIGFMLVAVSAAAMTASFGLLMSTLGQTETQSRAVSILVIFVMLATGGAWFPLSKMPDLVQRLAELMPVRWAVEGFDAMTWRGLPIGDAAKNASILCGFAAIYAAGSMLRFARIRVDR